MSNVVDVWKFWRTWVLTCLGSGFGGFVLGAPIFVLYYENFLGTIIGWGIVGIFWGTIQYFFLNYYVPKINFIWIIVSVAGVLVGYIIAVPILSVLEKNLGWAVIGALGAIFQYLVLRQHFLRSSGWILASGVGVALSMVIGKVVFRVVMKAIIGQPATGDSGLSTMARVVENIIGSTTGFAVGGVLGLAIYGAITGGTLVWLLRHPRLE